MPTQCIFGQGQTATAIATTKPTAATTTKQKQVRYVVKPFWPTLHP